MQEIEIIFENQEKEKFPIDTTIYDIAKKYQEKCSTTILGDRINN